MRHLLLAAALLGVMISAPLPVFAAEDDAPAPVATLTPQAQADLKRVEDYINSISTVSARFTQKADFGDGTAGVLTGQFKMWRPGRLRIDYDAPSKDFIVADGRVIHQWDGEMKQASQTGVDDTLPGFLLRRNLKFNGDDVTVTAVTHPGPDRMEISLRSVKEPTAGELTLVLSEVPLRLMGWRVLDAQNLKTEVLFEDIQQGVTFERSTFIFEKPVQRR